ncbi:hypothetical protein YC2023_034309 [Brassica napus]
MLIIWILLLDAVDCVNSPDRDVSKPLLMPICDVVRSNSHGQVSACGKLESGAVRSGSKDSNESGLHYWNFVLDNGYAIGRTGTVRALRVAPLQGWR